MSAFSHLISDRAKPENCRRCRMPVWKLHVGGYPFQLDVQPVGLADELTARQAGRTGFQLFRDSPTFTAAIRNQWNIPATQPDTIVLLAHLCDSLSMISGKHPEYFPKPTQTENAEPLF